MLKRLPVFHFIPFPVVIFIIIFSSTIIFGQGSYYIYNNSTLPDQTLTEPTNIVQRSPNFEDVKAVGIGRTQIANGRWFNAMLYNPAFLGDKKKTFDIFGVSASLPPKSFSAAQFLSSNVNNFIKGDFIKQFEQGLTDYIAANNESEINAAIHEMNQSLQFVHDLYSKVIIDPNDPEVHGLNVVPDINVQYDNFGFSLYGDAQIGFLMIPTETSNALNQLYLPENGVGLDQQSLNQLILILGAFLNNYNNDLSVDVLPQAFALSYVDVVGAFGYGMKLSDNFNIGADIKVINRRFSTKYITTENYSSVLNEARKDINKSITGVTADIGGFYRFEKTKTQVGLSLQNIIPLNKVVSDLNVPYSASYYDYYRDANGNIQVGYVDQNHNFTPNPNGDTLLTQIKQKYHIIFPFELKAPFLANIGVLQNIFDNWDVSMDIVDLFKNDNTFENYTDRIRLGSEYRILHDLLAFRAGLSDLRATLGFGLNLKYLQFDFAYAYDNFITNYSLYLQLKLRL